MLKEELASCEERITNLERREIPITVREAMRILERYICLESVGYSKTSFSAKFYNIDQIGKSGDHKVIAKFNSVLHKLGLTEDHLAYLGGLKDYGDSVTHDNRPQVPKADWDNMHVYEDEEVEEDGTNISMLWKGLIDALATYIPPPSEPSEPWVILDPVSKSKKTFTTPKSSTTTSTDGSTASTPTSFGK